MKTPSNINIIGTLVLLLVFTVLLISCNGCRSSKVADNTGTTLPDAGQVVTQADTTRPQPHQATMVYTYEQPGYISLLPADDSVVDAYNVRKYILEFRSPATHEVIKTIDLVKENPFHSMGLKRRKEPYPAVYYFLMPEGKTIKMRSKSFCPKRHLKKYPMTLRWTGQYQRYLCQRQQANM